MYFLQQWQYISSCIYVIQHCAKQISSLTYFREHWAQQTSSCVLLLQHCAQQICSFLCAALKEFHRVSLLLNCIEHIFLCLYSSMLKNKYHPIFSMRHSAQQISVCLRPAIRACINFFIMFLPLQHCARLISSCVSRPNKNRNKALQEYGQQQENVKKRTRKCSSRMLYNIRM